MPAFSSEHLRTRLSRFPDARRCWIAYSGGMDSEVLLHAAAALRDRVSVQIQAVHVDHGLQPDSARWADHCGASCARFAVPLRVLRLEISAVRGESLEAVAREARYRVLAALLEAGDLLLTAHHRGDQAETLLLALLRGSGVRGLAAMPPIAALGEGRLVRPLLDVGRGELRAYALKQGLDWVDDPSNWDLTRDRNFLRHRVLPVLAERWPAWEVTLARTAGHCADAEALVAHLAARTTAGFAGGRSGTLSIQGIQTLDLALRRAAIRYWIVEQGFRPPDAKHLGRILDEVLTARPDGSPLVAWSGCEIRRHRDDLFALAPLPPPLAGETLSWTMGALVLPSGLGQLRLLNDAGEPLDPAAICAGGLRVRFGVPGLSCLDLAGRHHHSLKKLFQERGVPAWLRQYVPLVFAGDRLTAVGDLWVCRSPCADESHSISLLWEGHPWEGWLARPRCQATP